MMTDPATTPESSTPRDLDEPTSRVDLLVVIVNYRSADLTVDCLASLEPEIGGHPGALAVVVENDSGPDQLDRIRDAVDRRGWGGWVRVVAAGRNGGFAAGNNVAIRPALGWSRPPALFWLLNPDTLVLPGSLEALKRILADHPGVGLVGSRLEHADGTPQVSAFRFPSVLGELETGLRLGPVSHWLRHRTVSRPIPAGPEAVDWVAGASLLVRREVFDAVGLLDERYFMYYEEVDLCRRAAAAGWACWYAPASRVVHLIGQSGAVTSVAGLAQRRPRYWFDARKHYFRTHHGRLRTVLANAAYVGGFATFRFRRLVQRKPDHDPRMMLWDLFRHNFLPVRR